MLYDAVDEVADHVTDIKTRLNNIAEAVGKSIFAYSQEEFLNKAKELQFPAVGIFYAGILPEGDRRSQNAELIFNLVVADDPSSGGCTTLVDQSKTTTLLAELRKEMKLVTAATQKSWSFVSELPFPLSDNSKLAYIQQWTAVLTKT